MQAGPQLSCFFVLVQCHLGTAPPSVRHCILGQFELKSTQQCPTPSLATFFALQLLGHRIATPWHKTLDDCIVSCNTAAPLTSAADIARLQDLGHRSAPGARTASPSSDCARRLLLQFCVHRNDLVAGFPQHQGGCFAWQRLGLQCDSF